MCVLICALCVAAYPSVRQSRHWPLRLSTHMLAWPGPALPSPPLPSSALPGAETSQDRRANKALLSKCWACWREAEEKTYFAVV